MSVAGIFVSYEGGPVAWARVKRNAKGQAYTPAKQKAHRTGLAWAIKAAAGKKKFAGSVAVNVQFDYENKLTSITITEAVEAGKTTRPDVDNLLKQVLEAIEESGVIEDDAQVVFVTARKV
jgi:Holliday junction resolvase RusA-like endonuclease